MHKSNLQRNGQSNYSQIPLELGTIQWRLKDLTLLSADKNIAFESGYLYCIATRSSPLDVSFYAIDAKDGHIEWSIELDKVAKVAGSLENAEFSAPVVSNQLAYFLYKPTRTRLKPILFCVDIKSQQIEFSTDVHKSMGKKFVDGTIHEYKRLLRSSPLVIEDSVYIGTGNGCICSFDVKTGKLQWTLTLTDESAIGHIAYYDGFLYVQSGNRDLYAVNIAKRSTEWKFEHDEDYKLFVNWYDLCPVVLDSIVYIYGSLKSLFAIERKTGRLLWKYTARGISVCRNFVATQTLLVGVMPDSKVHAVDARTGKNVWTAMLGDPITGEAPSVVINDTLFVSDGGVLYRVDANAGTIKEQWRIPFYMEMMSHPLYWIVQLIHAVTRITVGSPVFSSVSSPCITKEGIFVATETGPDCSMYRLSPYIQKEKEG